MADRNRKQKDGDKGGRKLIKTGGGCDNGHEAREGLLLNPKFFSSYQEMKEALGMGQSTGSVAVTQRTPVTTSSSSIDHGKVKSAILPPQYGQQISPRLPVSPKAPLPREPYGLEEADKFLVDLGVEISNAMNRKKNLPPPTFKAWEVPGLSALFPLPHSGPEAPKSIHNGVRGKFRYKSKIQHDSVSFEVADIDDRPLKMRANKSVVGNRIYDAVKPDAEGIKKKDEDTVASEGLASRITFARKPANLEIDKSEEVGKKSENRLEHRERDRTGPSLYRKESLGGNDRKRPVREFHGDMRLNKSEEQQRAEWQRQVDREDEELRRNPGNLRGFNADRYGYNQSRRY